MIAQPQHLKMSVEAYLALDRESLDTRYEYIDGYAYLLVGGTPIHSLIAANLMRSTDEQPTNCGHCILSSVVSR